MSHEVEISNPLYGTVAEFDTVDALMAASEAARDYGFKVMDAYTPFPVHGMSEAIGFKDNKIPYIVALGGITGTITGMSLQYYTAVVDYPMNVGGKPLFSLPAYVPVMFELTILFSALSAFFGMWILNGLPRYHHPIFSAKNFERATVDRFFLCIEAKDPKYDQDKIRNLMAEYSPLNVSEVMEPEF